MKILSQMLQPEKLETFLEKNFTKLPYSSTHGAMDLTHLLDWNVVDKIVESKKAVLRIVQDGKVIKDYVELSTAEAHAHHTQGHTLLVRFAEKADSRLMNLARDFSDSFHTPVDIQLYCTPEGHNAFGWHYDVEEVFIIQCEGSKAYTIRPNTWHPNPLVASIPKDLGYENEKSSNQLKVTLEKGDWLYIPSGWWHVAQTQKESMHISVGMMPNSALDLVSYLPGYLAQNPFWRTRMPVHKPFENENDEIAFYQDALLKLGNELGKQLSSPAFIREFLRAKRKK